MNLYGSGNTAQNDTNKGIFSMSMTEIKPMLCAKSKGDPYICIDCASVCPFGRRAIELLEKETKGTMKPMNRKQVFDATKRIEAMETYLEVMSAKDPVAYVKTKFNITVDRTAKNKIYQWQHNYGTNLNLVANRIKEIKAEIAASNIKPKEESTIEKIAKIAQENPVIPGEEKKPTKRQEEKISKHHLEQMRIDLEEEYLSLEKQIEEHKKEIEKCEKRISAIVEETNAIRAVLDIFKKKDEIYV